MTTSVRPTTPPDTHAEVPPLSRAAQIGAGLSLVLAGLLNGGAPYAGHLLMGDLDFSEQIRWGTEHPVLHQVEQSALLASLFFLPLGILGLAQVCRWRSPRLTATATVLALWGMWGFHTIIALGYTAGTVAPGALGVDDAVALNEAFLSHTGVTAVALVPHLVGSFLGMLLLAVAGWRSRVLHRVPLVLLVVFLLWDFLASAVGPLEPHLLLMASLVWLGVQMVRLPRTAWAGAPATTENKDDEG